MSAAGQNGEVIVAYYKFLRAEHLDYVVDGSLRLGSLQSYRLAERFFGNQWIGDRNDAVLEMPVHDGVVLGTGGRIAVIVNGNRAISTAEGFVFSFAEGEIGPLKEEFGKDRPGMSGYSSCVEILDPTQLLEAIKAGTCISGIHAGKIVADVGAVKLAAVTYDRTADAISPFGGNCPPNAFVKDARFSIQREWRVFIDVETTDDYLDIRLQKPASLFVERIRGADLPSPSHDIDVAWTNLRALVPTALKEFQDATGRQEIKFPIDIDEYMAKDARGNSILESVHLPTIVQNYAVTRSERKCAEIDRMLLMPVKASMLVQSFERYIHDGESRSSKC